MKREARGNWANGQLGKWAKGAIGAKGGKWKNGQLQKVKHMCNARVKG
jgi:hypothetical protein